MAVTVTVGTNSYISVADCTTYMGNRLYATAWTGAVADDMAKALIMATKAIDRQVLKGRKYLDTQALAFPRCYTVDPLAPSVYTGALELTWENGWYCETAVPQVVKDACCEEALALLDRGDSKRRLLQQQGVKSFSLGSMSESYTGSGRGLISQEAREFLRPYLGGAVAIT